MVELTCDLGEGYSHDKELMKYLDTCSIACGGHIGDRVTVEESINLALDANVKVGAHPSFPDRLNFGRSPMELSDQYVQDSLKTQLDLFFDVAASKNAKVYHIKPHGALYNQVYHDAADLEVFCEIISGYPFEYLYVLAGRGTSDILASLNVKTEAFADRRYNPDLSLRSRSEKDSLIASVDMLHNHLENLVKFGRVEVAPAEYRSLNFDTLCLHGDGAKVLKFAAIAHNFLNKPT